MIIWSGYGFLVFVIVFIDSLIANFISDSITKDENFYSENLIPLGVSFLFSALVIMLFSKYFDKRKSEGKGTRVFDKVTIAKGNRNRLFFIPFQYWSYIMTCLGLGVILYQLIKKQ
ncbi:hypothetical protein A9P82_03900 [Arachidicoccus ginsenosidimutans]|uniref:hypothetical protein n=1 Tax=Arachidicoccus sp. BS20 TaxID=1850526 RepID=UPI0007F17172|nr:hypothetical protein [Arachidicoccus sp. BS20]ANI88516.1 hypothetical protein A9P82_03900 [Arachidicoccus sp. BS20]